MANPPIDIQLNEADRKTLERTLRGIKGAAAKAEISAVNKTARQGRTLINRGIRKELSLKASRVNDRLDIDKATKTRKAALIRVSGKPIPLIDYKAKELKRGVSVKVRKGEGREKYRHMFIARGRGGVKQVWQRVDSSGKPRFGEGSGKANRRWGQPDTPIEKQVGPTVLGVLLNKPGMLRRQLADIQKTLLKNVVSQIDRALRRSRRR